MSSSSDPIAVILIADDEPDHANLLERWLRSRGYRTVHTVDGQTTLEEAPRLRPDLILLDVTLPDVSGYEVCGRLKADPTTADTPVIFLSGRASVEEKVEGLSRGANDYVTKPFDLPELLARIQAALRLRSAMQTLRDEQSRLQLEATTDALTGVANRAYLDRRLIEEHSRAAREGTPLACLLLDVDHFKAINDRHGHLTGDMVLREIGDILRRGVRGEDTAARYGGEEFAILMPGATAEGACTLAERLRAAVEAHEFRQLDRPERVHVTVSIGGAVRRARETEPEALLERADTALYRAKHAGRNQVVVEGT